MGAIVSEGYKPCQPRWSRIGPVALPQNILTYDHLPPIFRGIVTLIIQLCLVFLTLLQKGTTLYEYLG